MSATNAFETAILNHILNNADVANIGDATGLRGSSTDGNLYISLHTADPDETGDQESSEADYTDYARVAIARSGAAWTVSGNNASNAGAVTFPAASAGTNAITHFGIGTASTGAGNLLFKGALSDTLNVSAGITPSFAIGELDVNAD